MIPKFRAWDKRDEQMKGVLGMSFYHKTISVDNGRGRFLQDRWDRFGLMQSTGLKDKFGTEIFESDIVTNGRGEVGYIAYLTQEAGWVVVTDKRDYRLGHRNTGESYMVADDHAVIGNTYEGADQ